MTKPRRSLTDRHMTRLEMLKAAGHESDSTGHLSMCAECREAVELLRQFHLAGRPPLPDPPKAWVERATAIPSSRWPRKVLAQVQGLITFDSWLQPDPVGVRGASTTDERRVCCQTESHLLDLRAEKHSEGWRMVAQLSGAGSETAELKDGARTVPADRNALFQWSSARPPQALSVRVGETEILVPKLSWKRPHKK